MILALIFRGVCAYASMYVCMYVCVCLCMGVCVCRKLHSAAPLPALSCFVFCFAVLLTWLLPSRHRLLPAACLARVWAGRPCQGTRPSCSFSYACVCGVCLSVVICNGTGCWGRAVLLTASLPWSVRPCVFCVYLSVCPQPNAVRRPWSVHPCLCFVFLHNPTPCRVSCVGECLSPCILLFYRAMCVLFTSQFSSSCVTASHILH